jgi:hypothetical protein
VSGTMKLPSGFAGTAGPRASRRGFLLGSGAAVLSTLLLSACGDDDDTTAGAGVTTTTADERLTGDLALVGLVVSLENLVVATYRAGLDTATAGGLGAVPPAVTEFLTTAQKHHEEHAAAWNSVLTAAGRKEVSGVDVTLKTDVDRSFADVNDAAGLATLALELENVVAATYLRGIETMRDENVLKTAASIQPVEMQHAALLDFMLGNDPVPSDFSETDGARDTDDEIGEA